MLLEVLVTIFVLIIVLFVKQYNDRRKHPPGPLGFPFFGEKPFRILQFFLPKLFPPTSETQYFKDMKKKYGNIWSVDDGDRRINVLASIELITEAFVDNGKLFSGRPTVHMMQIMGEKYGIVFSEGEMWQSNRQLAIKSLRDLGMGKQLLEQQICEEVLEFIEIFDKNKSSTITSPKIFIKAASNVIFKMIFGERNKYEDPEFENYIKNLHTISHAVDANVILELFSNIIPEKVLRRLFPSVEKLKTGASECLRIIGDKCKQRIKVEKEFSKPNCVFDFFWRYRYQDEPDVKYEEKLKNITLTMFELSFGGTDTINNVIGFSFLFLGQNQDLQNDLRNEIQCLVDDYTLINMELRKNCPKLLSFIDEIYRYCPLDFLLFRRALSDCVFHGYTIQSKDVVYGDLRNMLRDPNHFENPDVFDAYRFLDKSRTKYIPHKSVIPFGIGKRNCIGESIALMVIFLFLSKMILKFHITLPSDTMNKFDEIVEGECGLLHSPLIHEIIIQPIQSK